MKASSPLFGKASNSWPVQLGTARYRAALPLLIESVQTMPAQTPFAERTERLFGLLGFRPHPSGSAEAPLAEGALILDDASGPLSRTYVVHCHDQAAPVGLDAYEALRAHLAGVRSELTRKARGILVASVGFAAEVERLSVTEDLELLTISELEQSVIDFRVYVRELVVELERDPSLSHYIEPQILREHRQREEAAEALLDDWLRDPEINHLTLLGDYGTGKTTLLRATALRLARRYEVEVVAGGARGRVPIYVDLRRYTAALSLKQIILDLLDHHEVRVASYAAFEYLGREGRLLLILDGFDEMASRGNPELTLRNFRELNKQAVGRAKILLSCRTHYFTDHRDLQSFLHAAGPRSVGPRQAESRTGAFPLTTQHTGPPRKVGNRKTTRLYQEIATRRNFVVGFLQDFDEDQVAAYLDLRCGSAGGALKDFIDRTYHLAELARRPVLLDLIVQSQARLEAQGSVAGPVRAGDLYAFYVDIWLSRNDWSTVIDIDTKARLLEAFAARAMGQQGASLPRARIPELIAESQPGLTSLDAAEVDQELRRATFLVRDAEGHYRFSHRSFLEFFYARHLLAQAAAGVAAAWAGAFFPTEVYRFAQDLASKMPLALGQLLAWVEDGDQDEYTRANAIKVVAPTRRPEVRALLLRLLAHAEPERLRHFAAIGLGHHPDDTVVDALIAAAEDDSAPHFVQSNTLLALGRLRHPRATAYLLQLLDLGTPIAATRLWSLHQAAHAAPPALAAACIRHAQAHLDDPATINSVLELCTVHPSPEAEATACAVLGRTRRIKDAALAAELLSPEALRPFLPALVALLDANPSHAYAGRLLAALRGCAAPPLREFLVAQAGASHGPLAPEAFAVLAADHPEVAVAHGPAWLGPGRPFPFRNEVASFLVAQAPETALPLLEAMLTRNQRVAIKLHVLELIATHAPERLAPLVAERWADEPAIAVKRQALELLVQIDVVAARQLMLEHGVRARRNGTRVAVCALLGSLFHDDCTRALLVRLARDRSRWVRLQALRSLCTPGRGVAPQDVVDAMVDELDTELCAERQRLLGV